jgi:L-seryl-tRNA(Ser) seleniumtransferase
MSQPELRDIPSVAAVLAHPDIESLLAGRQRSWMTRLVQQTIGVLRGEFLNAAGGGGATREDLLRRVVVRVLDARRRLLGPTMRRVINGTGVIVHTNLGRSLFPELAIAWAERAARFPTDLEYVLETGRRGHRGRKVEEKIALLAGADDALIVNNNAAAVWLAARSCAAGGRIILSRGEAVAIGGSFRIHEILRETGCELTEVGTTNRTSLQDYGGALTPGAVVMKVHRSNFEVVGFTEEVPLRELAALCRQRGHVLIYDAGSGALFPFAAFGLPQESSLEEDVAAGPDLVCCSGDKLLGGCQAGFILGRADLVAAMRRQPMRRTFRVDKTTLAAVDAVLTLYLRAEEQPSLPTLDAVALAVDEVERRAQDLWRLLREDTPAHWRGGVVAGESSVGGGSFSDASLETRLVLWEGPKEELEACHARLRQGDPALVTRISQEGLAIDLRSVTTDEFPLIVTAFRNVWRAGTTF